MEKHVILNEMFYIDESIGTSTMGFLKHIKVRLSTNQDNIDGFFKFSVKAYGTFETNMDKYGLNGRMLDKHKQYDVAVNEYFGRLKNYINTQLTNIPFKNDKELIREIKKLRDMF